MLEEEPSTKVVIENIVELLGIMSNNIIGSQNNLELVTQILSNITTIEEIHEERIRKLEQRLGHTHWWQR